VEDQLDDVLDLEGRPSAISADTDADGVADMVMGDDTGDGRADWIVTRNADGSTVALVDSDLSGSLETGLMDTDDDGTFDAATRDFDDDGDVDVTQLDEDRDGVLETMVLADETIIRIDPDSGLVTDVSEAVRDSVKEPTGFVRAPSTAATPASEPIATPAPTNTEPISPVAPSSVVTPSAPAPATTQPATNVAPTAAVTPAAPAVVSTEPTGVAPNAAVTSTTPAPVSTQPATDVTPQTPWHPDQPGIGDNVVTTPSEPATDATPQTPWAPDQPGLGDDSVPPTEPEVTPVVDLVHGDGSAEVQWGQIQTENGYCGPVSIAMVLSELTGVPRDETQMVQAALDRDMLVGEPGAWIGMYVQDVATLLTEYGAPSHVETGTLDSLRTYLDHGRDIILFVDSSEVWQGIDDDGTAGDRQDHFLVITEIDDERGVATLNDPGIPNGVGREVSLTVIEDAWQAATRWWSQTMASAMAAARSISAAASVGPASRACIPDL
jgi:Peptidase_C39 like family